MASYIMLLVWKMAFMTALLWNPYHFLNVSFPYQGPLHVAKGSKLVLKVQFEKTPTERIKVVTWKRKTEMEERPKRLVNNTSFDQQGARWELEKMTASDYGVFTVAVTTDQDGHTEFATMTVEENESPPNASLFLQCEVANGVTQWDQPTFTWLVDEQEVSNQTAKLYADGSRLYLSEMKCHNYTCVVKSSLGTSYSFTNCSIDSTSTQSNSGCVIACSVLGVLIGVLLVVVIAIGAWVYKHRKCPRRFPRNAEANGENAEAIALQ